MADCFRLREDGIDLFVRLTPKSAKDAIEGIETMADGRSYLAARVRAAPDKGAANAALESLLAIGFAVPKRSVSVAAGGTSRLKTVRIAGDARSLGETLTRLGSVRISR